MALTQILAIGGAVVCALAYLGLTFRDPSVLRSVVKTASVALLAVAALLAQAPGAALALGLCALGDFLLSRPGERAFAAGVGAFAAGHLAYVVVFLGLEQADPSRLSDAVAPIIALAVFGIAMARLLIPRAGALAIPVALYIPIILSMGVAALTLPPVGGLALILPAALLFIASDLILSFETFVLPEDHRARRITPFAVWSLYWSAQAMFLSGLAGLP